MPTTDDIRIIICGPRDCPHHKTAARLVRELALKYGERLTIVHGGCPSGTDAHVHEACREAGIRVEVNFADWHRHGNPAGPIRNRSMGLRGAHACYALSGDQNDPVRGTGNMLREAKRAHVTRFVVTTAENGTWTIRAPREAVSNA